MDVNIADFNSIVVSFSNTFMKSCQLLQSSGTGMLLTFIELHSSTPYYNICYFAQQTQVALFNSSCLGAAYVNT